MGTDENGRDVLSGVIYGARASMLAAALWPAIGVAAGVPPGMLAGLAGGWVDAAIDRAIDRAVDRAVDAMVAISVSAAPAFVRMARAAAMDVATEGYVETAVSLGNPPWRITLRHVLSNIAPPLLVQATLAMADAIVAEASLCSLGRQPPEAS